ncbi:MAG: RNA methyltransferase [Bacilli bacterium]|nr:RNA methyltransferase [Bacilli bacterium]
MYISSLENKKIKEYIKLKQKKYRDSYNKFIIEGEHLVEEALNSGFLLDVLVLDTYDYQIDFEKTYVTKEILKSLSDLDNHSLVIGICKKIDLTPSSQNKILILDGIQDPGNLGTIIRTSKAFGIDMIFLSEDTVDLYNSKVIRATQGIIFYLPIKRCDIIHEIKLIKHKGITIYGTDVINGIDIRNISNYQKDKFCIIMGNEGNGLRYQTKELVDKNLYINMDSTVESLNVSIATSIILYEFTRR